MTMKTSIRQANGVTIVDCSGRIVLGDGSEILKDVVRELLSKGPFAHLRETYITGAQSAFEQARDVTVADIVEAIDLQVGGAQELKTASGAAPGFIPTHLSKPDSSSFGGNSG